MGILTNVIADMMGAQVVSKCLLSRFDCADFIPDGERVDRDSLNFRKDATLRIARENPELTDRLYFRDTWGSQIIDELKPQEGDILIEKPRYSAFAGTTLDMTLRGYDTRYAVFVGIATNGCVEASIRDAYNFEYWPILVSDACANAGPEFTQEATLWYVKTCLGWVTTSDAFARALE